MKKNKINLIIVADDTSEKTKKEMKFICDKYKIPMVIFGNIEGNSHAIGKKNRALIGICDMGISNKILQLIREL